MDVRFDSDGTVQKKLTGVVHDELATPVNQRFEAWRLGAVSDRVEALLNEVDAEKGMRDAVYDKYARSLAAPGEAVGALAAQSVGSRDADDAQHLPSGGPRGGQRHARYSEAARNHHDGVGGD